MKFNKRKMCRLNESVLSSIGADIDKLDVVGTIDQSFVETAVEQTKRVEHSREALKDFHKNADDFIKTNHNRETKAVKDAGLKKMKLSESIFDNYETVKLHTEDEDIVVSPADNKSVSPTINEAIDFGDPTAMGRGACAPLANNYTKTIQDCVAALDDERTANLASIQLTRYYSELLDKKNEVENFNAYWTERYPAMIKFIDDQVALIPRNSLNFDDANESVEEPLIESPAAVAEPETKKRARSANEKKYKGDYSSEDLWLAVYDELSAELDNEGSGQQVDKQIKAKKGERYEHVYPVEGSNDIVVYATSPDKFEFAKRVCDYYEVTHDEPKEDRNSTTNEYYKYSMRIHIPEDEIYQWD